MQENNPIEKMMNETDRPRREELDNRAYVYEPDWRPQHRARAIVRLERLERAYARHEEILGRINALLDIAARKSD